MYELASSVQAVAPVQRVLLVISRVIGIARSSKRVRNGPCTNDGKHLRVQFCGFERDARDGQWKLRAAIPGDSRRAKMMHTSRHDLHRVLASAGRSTVPLATSQPGFGQR
jgi:hypothetical protein